ncbi:MAG: dephospho-CoA kinase [Rikenellaceae bacterium]
MLKVGITGGIGSGKSTLCSLFKDLGIAIYNSDSQAKRLMSEDAELRREIIDNFGPDSYIEGQLNRHYLAAKVFSNSDSLSKLNSLVHPRVKDDFEKWCHLQDSPYVILECAILFEGDFDKYVDRTLCVLSPKQLRVERIISRDNLTSEEINNRIAAQLADEKINALSDFCVVNIDIEDLENAATIFDKRFRHEAECI